MAMRHTIRIVALALVAGACGNALQGVGDVSRRVVHGDETTTTTTVVEEGPSLQLEGITDLVWANDGMDGATVNLTVDDLVTAVWLRSEQVSPFAQATRREIATALPGAEFPRLAPEAVTHASSQLVYDAQTATLDVSTAAAFGLWVGEPYTAPRSESQLVVLRIGLRTEADDIQEGDYFSFRVADGRELTWAKGEYVYSLFCRTGVSEESCFAMAESTSPLSLLALIPSNEDLAAVTDG